MRIYNIEDIKEGHWITFMSRYNDDKLIRRFYKIIGINDDKFYCVHHFKIKDKDFNQALAGDHYYNTIIDNLFKSPSDEVYETFDELRYNFPEEFLKEVNESKMF